MSLLGKAAIVIWCDITPEMRVEHDAWHSGEHLPERMAVPGFRRGRRALAADAAAQQRFVLYEIDHIGVATSAPYLQRLNNPTPWSKKIMAQCRLSRTLCRVTASHGAGVGARLATMRFAPIPGEAERLRIALTDRLPQLARRPGLAGAHLLEKDAGTSRPLTNEERLRRGGGDDTADWVLVIEGYGDDALRQAAAADDLLPHGAASQPALDYYLLSHVMTPDEALPV